MALSKAIDGDSTERKVHCQQGRQLQILADDIIDNTTCRTVIIKFEVHYLMQRSMEDRASNATIDCCAVNMNTQIFFLIFRRL